MMTRIACFLLLAIAGASGATLNSYTLTVTSLPLGGPGTNITINGTTRAWTNATTASTIQTNLNGMPHATTNLFNAYGSFVQVGLSMTWLTATQLTVRGPDLTMSLAGAWGTITTNIGGTTNLVAISGPPWFPHNTNATNFGNWIAKYLSDYADTNSVKTNAQSMQKFLTKGITYGGGVQDVEGPVTFRNVSGTNGGTITGGRYHGATLTNTELHSVFMKPFGPDETNYGTIWFYDGATNLVAAIRANTNGYPSLFDASAEDPFQFDGPFLTDLSTNNAEALVNMFSAVTWFPVLQPVLYANRITNLWTSTNFWASAGNRFSKILFLDAGMTAHGGSWSNALVKESTYTNSTFKGTNTVTGDVAVTAQAVTTLVNGFNSAVNLGGGAVVTLSGPTGNYTNRGFLSPGRPEWKMVRFDNPNLNVTIENQDGGDNDTNRVVTGTGTRVHMTNNPAWAQMYYNMAVSRWEVQFHSR